MQFDNNLTFKKGCEKYLDNCRQRNLREGTINHYRQSYRQFYKYFNPEMPVEELTKEKYNKYVVYLRETIDNDVSSNSYLRDLITTLHFFMNEGYLEHYKMQAIKVDKNPVETYTDEELEKLLKKPDMKKCSFAEYQSWVKVNNRKRVVSFMLTTLLFSAKFEPFWMPLQIHLHI